MKYTGVMSHTGNSALISGESPARGAWVRLCAAESDLFNDEDAEENINQS